MIFPLLRHDWKDRESLVAINCELSMRDNVLLVGLMMFNGSFSNHIQLRDDKNFSVTVILPDDVRNQKNLKLVKIPEHPLQIFKV